MCPLLSSETYFSGLANMIDRLPHADINRAAERLLAAHARGRTVYVFGNGGSAALASHVACDLGKGTVNGNGRRFRALSLTDNVPLITAWANDTHFEHIFSEQLQSYLRPHDVALAISGSGNSPNIIHALLTARKAGAITIGLGGFQGGRMKELCDVCVVVPSDNMQFIEDMHVCIAHALFTCVRYRLQMPSAQCA
jgi:D-sedoheptulose 7-phosphate isomerase